MPFDRLFNWRRLVNTGSVGMPYGHAGAAWAPIGSEIVLHRTPYDVEAAARLMLETGMPGADDVVDTCVRVTPSDAEALDGCHPILRRQRDERGSV